MPVSLDQFIEQLSSTGLVSAAEVSALTGGLPAEQRPADAEALAKLLVRQGKLTRYQASTIYQGKAKLLRFGDYIILDRLGAGGMGIVFKARHRRLDRVVAIKVLSPTAMKAAGAVERFYREVKAAGRLVHPNIVVAHDAGEHDGTHYLAMEYVEGMDLSALVAQRGPLTVPQAVECILQAAKGLEYAHGMGVIHRDIKPGNLLLSADGTVKILDMGLARLGAGSDAETAAQLTQSGQIMGTIDYMSPEQAQNTRAADERSDIYSLGCTLYRLLMAEPPYPGDSLMSRLLAHREDPIPSLCDRRDDVPEALDDLFQRMVAKHPDDRPQTMGEVVEELRAILEPENTEARRVTDESSSVVELTDYFRQIIAGSGPIHALSTHTDEETIQRQEREEQTRRQSSAADTNGEPGRVSARSESSPTVLIRQRKQKLARVIAVSAGIGLAAALISSFWLLKGPNRANPIADKGNQRSPNTKTSPDDKSGFMTPIKTEPGKTEAGKTEPGKTEDSKEPPITATPTTSGWSDLFNGKDLAGWSVFDAHDFHYETIDGQRVLLATKGTLFKESLQDYHLTLEFRTPAAGTGSGYVSYHNLSPDYGINLSLHRDIWGNFRLWNDRGGVRVGEIRDGRIVRTPGPPPSVKPSDVITTPWIEVKPPGQWNRLDLVCLGDCCLHAINGRILCVAAEMRSHEGKPLTAGGMRIVAGNDLAFRGARLRTITALPEQFGGPKEPKTTSVTLPNGWVIGPPQPIAPPISSASAGTPSLSADGLTLFFESTRPGGSGDCDLWMSTRAALDKPWGQPQNLGPAVNSDKGDGGPCLASDGLTLLFHSDRSGGLGAHDLWVCTKARPGDPWGKPVNLGPTVNSTAGDLSPALSGDGLMLVFQSDRGGQGNFDLWMCRRSAVGDAFGKPENLGPTVNSKLAEMTPCLSADGQTLLFARKPDGGVQDPDRWAGDYDLWISAWSPSEKRFHQAFNLGPTINGPFWDSSPTLSLDGKTLLFDSRRPNADSTYVAIYQAAITVPSAPSAFFNGKDLTGWDGDAKVWRVENGELVASQSHQPGKKYSNLTITHAVGDDFDLKFEARARGQDPTKASYLHFRSVASGSIALAIHDAGHLFRGTGGGFAPLGGAPAAVKQSFKYDNYNAYQLRVVGKRVTVTVNGLTASEGEYDIPPAGVFMWSLPPNCDELRIRNLRFTDLSQTTAATLLPNGWVIGPSVNLGPGVNSAATDRCPCLSADGLTLYFASNRSGGRGQMDLWTASRASWQQPFAAPTNLGAVVNSSAEDMCPCLSSDGLTLLFSSKRPGGQGNSDLWQTTRVAADKPFGAPANLAAVNTSAFEFNPCLSADGLTLLFHSNRTPGGVEEIWMSKRASARAPFGAPVKLGAEVNSRSAEISPCLSADGLTLLFGSKQPGGQGSWDLWMSRRAIEAGSFGQAMNLGPTINSTAQENEAWLSADGRMLFFSSDRAGGNGEFDIYQAPIRVLPTSQTIKPADGWVDVLSQADVVLDSMRDGGAWKREGDSLGSPVQDFARVAVPVQPKGNYGLRAEFTRVAGSGAASFYLPVGERQVLFVLDGWNGKGLSGLQSVGGNDEPIPAKKEGFTMPPLKNGQRYQLDVSVATLTAPGVTASGVTASAGIVGTLTDGKTAWSVQWGGPVASLSLVNPKFTIGDNGRLGVAAWSSQFQFHSLELKMTTGEAKLLRPPPANAPSLSAGGK